MRWKQERKGFVYRAELVSLKCLRQYQRSQFGECGDVDSHSRQWTPSNWTPDGDWPCTDVTVLQPLESTRRSACRRPTRRCSSVAEPTAGRRTASVDRVVEAGCRPRLDCTYRSSSLRRPRRSESRQRAAETSWSAWTSHRSETDRPSTPRIDVWNTEQTRFLILFLSKINNQASSIETRPPMHVGQPATWRCPSTSRPTQIIERVIGLNVGYGGCPVHTCRRCLFASRVCPLTKSAQLTLRKELNSFNFMSLRSVYRHACCCTANAFVY